MSKFKKTPEKLPKKKKKEISNEEFAFKTVKISAFLSGFFFLLSILFNGGIITIFMNSDTILEILDIAIKVGVIILFYFFIMISFGNYKELVGKPIEMKEIILLYLIALLQSCLHPYVFFLTLFGLIGITIYFYIIQES
jgi:hypothetical protein